jgi:glucose-1-phosphate thymidylyltransferase
VLDRGNKNSIITGPVAIADDSVITNSCIGSYTSISKGVIIDSCEVDNSIILEGTKLYNVNKRVSGSLIGKNVLIKGDDIRPFSNSFLIGDNSEIYIHERI